MTDKFTLHENQTLLEALDKIQQNKLGIVFVVNTDGVLKGALSDGDIRRALLSNKKTQNTAGSVANDKPVFVVEGRSNYRQLVLDCLSNGHKVLPIVDENHRIVDVITDYKAFISSSFERIHARAPLRCSLAGGGTDLRTFYDDHLGQTISLTIAKYANCIIERQTEQTLTVVCPNLDQSHVIDDTHDFKQSSNGYSNLVTTALKVLDLGPGYKVTVWNEVDVGSGLAGSTALVTSLIAAVDKLHGRYRHAKQIAELAFGIERINAQITGGWQDQFASSFGGANLISYSRDGHQVLPLKLSDDAICELESCLRLINTHQTHQSGLIQQEFNKNIDADQTRAVLDQLRDQTTLVVQALTQGTIGKIGPLLNEAWNLKRSLPQNVSNHQIDELYESIIASGGTGAKLLGAGSGGYFLVYVEFNRMADFEKKIAQLGHQIERFRYCQTGVQAWVA